MQFSAQQIATLVNGRIEGDPNAKVSQVAKIEEAKEGALSFVANPKYEEYLYTSKASIIIINETLQPEKEVDATLIRVKDAYSGFALLLEKYDDLQKLAEKTGIEQPSYVSPKAMIGKNVYIGAFCYICDDVVIGDNVKIYPGCYIGDHVALDDNCRLYPDVKIYSDCILGKNVVVHSGAVLGADGFGFAPQNDGQYKKVPQIGNVVIEDNVEIGANTTIDRATMGSTYIRKGVKLDNLIQIAHNVEIGENTVIAGQSGISGSTKVGKDCMIGGQVGIVGHIQVADGTRIGAQSGLSRSVTASKTAINGTPAFDYTASLKSHSIFRNLPEMQKRLMKLEDTVAELTSLLASQNMELKK